MRKTKAAGPRLYRTRSPGSRYPGTKRRGELAELAFLHRASKLGLKVSKPYGDSDLYDFIVDTGRRLLKVQVKSTGHVASPGVYSVNAGRHLCGGVVPYKRSQVDFMVVHIVPEDGWYILPMRVVGWRVSLRLPSSEHAKAGAYGKYREAWGLLEGQRAGEGRAKA